jgi:hypothetical protein
MPKLPTPPEWLRRSSRSASPTVAGVRVEIVVAAVVVAVVALVVLAVSFQGDSFDRDAAVARVTEGGAGRITPSQAECYVDRVRAEVGSRYLEDGAQPPDDVVRRLTSIRIDCIGLANLGQPTITDSVADTSVPSTESGNLPRRFGDDPALDELVAQCAGGSGQACDDLFDRAAVGSEYESFALTCGRRTSEPRCAAVYPAPPATDPQATELPGAPGG